MNEWKAHNRFDCSDLLKGFRVRHSIGSIITTPLPSRLANHSYIHTFNPVFTKTRGKLKFRQILVLVRCTCTYHAFSLPSFNIFKQPYYQVFHSFFLSLPRHAYASLNLA